LIFFISCSNGGDDFTDPVSQDIIPTNLSLTIEIIGFNTNNPNGDGSGVIKCTATATNAVKYGFKFGSESEQESVSGIISHTFTDSGINSYLVTVFAYSSTGNSISAFETIDVFVSDQIQLVWTDEFDIDGPISSSNWFAETVPPNNGSWWNGEQQHYTDRIDNAYVSNGSLKIVAKKENYTAFSSTKNYTSARLNSLFSFTYGKVEVRAKLPEGTGTWPAIWMLGANFQTVGWPTSGEIDIMEQTGWDKNKILATCHWFDQASTSNASYSLDTIVSNTSSEYHIYSAEWTETSIKMFVDDIEYYSIDLNSSLPFDADFFIILNIAMGGNLGGTIDPSFTEDTMEIDYVRVYQ